MSQSTKPKAYAYVLPDQQLREQEPIKVEAFDKIRQKKLQQKQRKTQRIWYIGLISVGLIIFLNSPLSQVKEITVTGNQYVSKQFVIENTPVEVGNHFYWLNGWEIEKQLETQPLIENVTMKRRFGNTIEFVVEEAEIMGITQTETEKMWILATGELVAIQANIRLNVPYFRNWDETNGKLLFENLAKIPLDVQRQISEIAFNGSDTDPEQLQLYMRDGNLVTISIRQIPEKMVFYFSIVEALGNKRMHIHLEAGNYAVAL
ncbi:MAG: cell division protein FtsQ/DivIB [Culicoidibacterales bacterium]